MVNIDKYFKAHPLKDAKAYFMSLEKYKAKFDKTGKEEDFLAEYLTTYLGHHPHVDQHSNWNGDPTRIFDMLPSSFWLNKLTFTKEEFPALKTAVDADLATLSISSDNFNAHVMDIDPEIMTTIKKGNYPNLEKYLLTYISNAHHILYPKANTPHSLLLKLFPTLGGNSNAERLILKALIISYSQAISDFYDENIPQTEVNKNYLAIAIRTTIMKLVDVNNNNDVTPEKLRNYTREAFTQDLTNFNEILKVISTQLDDALKNIHLTIKDWNKVVPKDEVTSETDSTSNHMKLNPDYQIVVDLKEKIKQLSNKNQEMLANDDITIPSNYIKNQISQIEDLMTTASKNVAAHNSSWFINIITYLRELLNFENPNRFQTHTPLEKDINEANATLIQQSTLFHP